MLSGRAINPHCFGLNDMNEVALPFTLILPEMFISHTAVASNISWKWSVKFRTSFQ